MNFLELVKNRYSCRAYKSINVEKEKLDYILECVRFAPSAVNKQPWLFHIVSNEEEKAKLQQCYNRDWFKTAPMYIIASIIMATLILPLPWSIFVWQQRSKVWLPAGYATLTLTSVRSSLAYLRMRNLP